MNKFFKLAFNLKELKNIKTFLDAKNTTILRSEESIKNFLLNNINRKTAPTNPVVLKNFIEDLTQKISRSPASVISDDASYISKSFIVIPKKTKNPVHTLLHEIGHQLDFIKNKDYPEELLLDERLANKEVITNLIPKISSSPQKNIEEFKNFTKLPYKTYLTTDPILEARASNLNKKLLYKYNIILNKLDRENRMSVENLLAVNRGFRKSVLQKDPNINKYLKKYFTENKEELKKLPWEE